MRNVAVVQSMMLVVPEISIQADSQGEAELAQGRLPPAIWESEFILVDYGLPVGAGLQSHSLVRRSPI